MRPLSEVVKHSAPTNIFRLRTLVYAGKITVGCQEVRYVLVVILRMSTVCLAIIDKNNRGP